jgi:hypothetical protein
MFLTLGVNTPPFSAEAYGTTSGWYGIESSGREAIKKGKALLTKYLFNT